MTRHARAVAPDPGSRHNSQACLTPLPLSEVGAGARLTHTAARWVELNGPPRRPRRYPVDLVAHAIRRHDGDVWPAVHQFGISYEHALRVRNGWRGAGRRRGRPMYWERSRNVGRRTPAWALL